MEIRSKVRKFIEKRKVVEIPKSVRDNFEIGEEVIIRKANGDKVKKKAKGSNSGR